MKIVLIRHGATKWSVSARHTGVTDLPLTTDGEKQAEIASLGLSRLLQEDPSEIRIFSSPLIRSLTTARIVCGSEATIVEDARLAEFNYGDFEGLTPTEIRDLHPGWDIWRHGCPNGETARDVGDRVDSFLFSLRSGGATNLVFSHGHLIRILAARAVGLSAECGEIFTLDTATISQIEDVRGKRVIKTWNLDPNLISMAE